MLFSTKMEPFWSRAMGINISIKNAPEELVAKLKERARRNHRSLQGEILAILDEASGKKRLTVMELYERGVASGLKTKSDSVKIIRAMRDGR
jgi:antitoxin FitA